MIRASRGFANMEQIDIFDRIDNGVADAAGTQVGKGCGNRLGTLLHHRMGNQPRLVGRLPRQHAHQIGITPPQLNRG